MEAPFAPRSAHPVAAAVACVHEALDTVTDAPVWSLTEADAGATLLDLDAEIARLQELRLRVAAHAHAVEVGDSVGATSTANWWAHHSRLTRPETHRLMRLARALDTGRHDATREALAAGRIHLDQAQVILDAVDDLPADLVDDEVRLKAEEFLLEQAREHDAITLRRLAKRLVEVAAPEQADAAEAARLEREEAAARAAARLTMSDDEHGKTHGRFTIPTHHAAMLRAALLAIAAPKHQHAVNGAGVAGAERRPGPERMGQAFCDYLERYPTDRLPEAGGVAATIVVTMPLESLLGGLRAAHLHTGETISATEARRLACEAGLVPAVLDGQGRPLDVGRRRRLHTRTHRIALAIRDGGCTAEGCDWPPGLCHAHHDQPWSRGGATSVANGRLLCPRHHARAHDPAYDTGACPTASSPSTAGARPTGTTPARRGAPRRPRAPSGARRPHGTRHARTGPPRGRSDDARRGRSPRAPPNRTGHRPGPWRAGGGSAPGAPWRCRRPGTRRSDRPPPARPRRR
ncbi:HNH endonuclease signature motif containing protein [Nocardioides sp. zg-DK7169]|uniref:HNH endonuclease signature motif containing protein n=1 Tax=Nocardioides sp. zg-DK7169 TaxID=2736600 RepID=UPI0020A6D59D|nr:HNH endonuclease signature motif containing protein [Nocardioides sp. zg-DK7169]